MARTSSMPTFIPSKNIDSHSWAVLSDLHDQCRLRSTKLHNLATCLHTS